MKTCYLICCALLCLNIACSQSTPQETTPATQETLTPEAALAHQHALGHTDTRLMTPTEKARFDKMIAYFKVRDAKIAAIGGDKVYEDLMQKMNELEDTYCQNPSPGTRKILLDFVKAHGMFVETAETLTQAEYDSMMKAPEKYKLMPCMISQIDSLADYFDFRMKHYKEFQVTK